VVAIISPPSRSVRSACEVVRLMLAWPSRWRRWRRLAACPYRRSPRRCLAPATRSGLHGASCERASHMASSRRSRLAMSPHVPEWAAIRGPGPSSSLPGVLSGVKCDGEHSTRRSRSDLAISGIGWEPAGALERAVPPRLSSSAPACHAALLGSVLSLAQPWPAAARLPHQGATPGRAPCCVSAEQSSRSAAGSMALI
jgi:hypothetical protein